MKYVSIPVRYTLILLGLLIGTAALAILWPQAALADDCLRDPFDAEDCLRTPGWAPILAGGVVWLSSLFASWGEVRNTLSSIRNGMPQMTASSGSVPHPWSGWFTWVNGGLRGANKTVDKATSNQQEADGNAAADKSEADKDRKTAHSFVLPVRIALGVVGAGVAILKAPLIGIGLIAIGVLAPDAIGYVIDFAIGDSKKKK